MDVMELRRGLLAQMASGVDISPWKIKKITAPSNMTKTIEVKAWLETSGVIPSCEFGIIILEKDRTEWVQNTFASLMIINGEAVSWNGSTAYELRIRGSTYWSQYFQSRSIANEDDLIVEQGDTYAIFYQ